MESYRLFELLDLREVQRRFSQETLAALTMIQKTEESWVLDQGPPGESFFDRSLWEQLLAEKA